MKKMKVLVLFGLLAIVVTPSVHSQTFDPYKSKMAIQMSLNPCSDEQWPEDTFCFQKTLSRLQSCKTIDKKNFYKLKFDNRSIYLVWYANGLQYWGVAYPNQELNFFLQMDRMDGSIIKIDIKIFYKKLIEIAENCDN